MLPFTCTPPVEANIEGVSRIHSSWSSESDLTTDSCSARCMPRQRHTQGGVGRPGGRCQNGAVGTSRKSNGCWEHTPRSPESAPSSRLRSVVRWCTPSHLRHNQG